MSTKVRHEYVQGGANFPFTGGRKTKAKLKEAIKENPTAVTLYGTSAMGPQYTGPASGLSEGTVFNVVGPDPYTDRSWYASVYRNKQGGLTVK